MSRSRAEAEKLLEGQRRAIREHIDKYNRYEHSYDKDTALKTIRRCQGEIRDIKSSCNVSTSDSWEDTWNP